MDDRASVLLFKPKHVGKVAQEFGNASGFFIYDLRFTIYASIGFFVASVFTIKSTAVFRLKMDNGGWTARTAP
jgi:hypothetical protein